MSINVTIFVIKITNMIFGCKVLQHTIKGRKRAYTIGLLIMPLVSWQ